MAKKLRPKVSPVRKTGQAISSKKRRVKSAKNPKTRPKPSATPETSAAQHTKYGGTNFLGWASEQNAIVELSKRAASGEALALDRLLLTATVSIAAIANAEALQPELVRSAMSKSDGWPVMLPADEHIAAQLVKYLKQAGVGSTSNMRFSSSQALRGESTLAKRIALMLHNCLMHFAGIARIRSDHNQRVELLRSRMKPFKDAVAAKEFAMREDVLQGIRDQQELLVRSTFAAVNRVSVGKITDEVVEDFVEACSELPELSQDSWKAWFALGRRLFMILTNDRPEDVPEFQKVAGLKLDAKLQTMHFKGSTYFEKMHRGKARDAIVSAIRSAFRNQIIEASSPSAQS